MLATSRLLTKSSAATARILRRPWGSKRSLPINSYTAFIARRYKSIAKKSNSFKKNAQLASTAWASLSTAQKKPFVAAAKRNVALRNAARRKVSGSGLTGYGLFGRQNFKALYEKNGSNFKRASRAMAKKWNALSAPAQAAYSRRAEARRNAVARFVAKQ